jgi:hypothetical protein
MLELLHMRFNVHAKTTNFGLELADVGWFAHAVWVRRTSWIGGRARVRARYWAVIERYRMGPRSIPSSMSHSCNRVSA